MSLTHIAPPPSAPVFPLTDPLLIFQLDEILVSEDLDPEVPTLNLGTGHGTLHVVWFHFHMYG